MNISMAHAIIADTYGICMIATTEVVVLATFILSQRLSQTGPSIGQTTCFK